MEFAAGDTVYLMNGQEAEFIRKIDNWFVVCKIYENEEGTYRDDYPIVIEKIFATPPVEKISKEIQEKTEQLANLRKEFFDIQKQKEEVQNQRNKLENNISYNNALSRIPDFLNNKITHFIQIEWRDLNIYTKDELLADNSNFYSKKGFKLLTLFGDTNGNFSWNINNYRDGSGGWTEVIPCTSFDNAKQCLVSILNEIWITTRKENNYTNAEKYIEVSKKYNIPIPDDIKIQYIKHIKDVYKNSVDQANKQHTQRLDVLDKNLKNNLDNL